MRVWPGPSITKPEPHTLAWPMIPILPRRSRPASPARGRPARALLSHPLSRTHWQRGGLGGPRRIHRSGPRVTEFREKGGDVYFGERTWSPCVPQRSWGLAGERWDCFRLSGLEAGVEGLKGPVARDAAARIQPTPESKESSHQLWNNGNQYWESWKRRISGKRGNTKHTTSLHGWPRTYDSSRACSGSHWKQRTRRCASALIVQT